MLSHASFREDLRCPKSLRRGRLLKSSCNPPWCSAVGNTLVVRTLGIVQASLAAARALSLGMHTESAFQPPSARDVEEFLVHLTRCPDCSDQPLRFCEIATRLREKAAAYKRLEKFRSPRALYPPHTGPRQIRHS